MAREFVRVFTHAELVEACLQADPDYVRYNSLGLAAYCEPVTEMLVGRELSCRFDDGTWLVFRFPDVETVSWSENGGDFHDEFCQSLLSSAGPVIGVHFYRRHVLPYEGAYLVVDLDTGFVTWVSMKIGTSRNDKDVHTFPHFGEIEGLGSHQGERHGFSTGLVGTVIDWQYNDRLTIRHSYVTPDITIAAAVPHDEDDESFIERRFLPSFHAKIRDRLFLASFAEPGGCAAVLLIDLAKVHDIGCFFGINGEGKLSSVLLAAYGGLGGAGIKAEVGYTKPFLVPGQ
jgi:hypothetical protein